MELKTYSIAVEVRPLRCLVTYTIFLSLDPSNKAMTTDLKIEWPSLLINDTTTNNCDPTPISIYRNSILNMMEMHLHEAHTSDDHAAESLYYS